MSPEALKRIAIIGLPGSGKSTFATILGKRLDIHVHHLDKHIFIGNIKRDHDDFLTTKQAILAEDSWIIEGCSIKTLEMRFARAQCVIYFDLPRWLCIWRVLKRVLVSDKIDSGCAKGVNRELLSYIWNFKKEKWGKIDELRKKYSEVPFLIFKSSTDAEAYLKNFSDLLNN